MRYRKAIAIVLLVGFGASACADKPVTAPRAVVPAKTYAITADRVLAVDLAGNRVAPLSVTEAARQAGGATALVSGLKGAGGGTRGCSSSPRKTPAA